MSKNDTTPTPATDAPASETPTDLTVVEKKPNPLVRGWHAIKRNPKTTLAVAGGAVLVTVAAAAGRATAPYHVEIVEDDFVPEPLVSLESDDSTVA